MFRTLISGCTGAVASASKHIHTSAVLCSQATKRTGARNKKINQQKIKQRNKVADSNRPSVVLGTRPNEEEEKWKKCLLAKVLVNEKSLQSPELVQKILAIGKIEVPKQLGFGVDTAEEEMLLNSLPVLTADMAQAAQQRDTNKLDMGDNEQIERDYNNNKQIELEKANRFAKVLDLRNANSAGIGFVNRQRIVKAFSTAENPFDPGRTEVQVALLTYKIRNLWKHLTVFKRDVGNRRSLRQLVHQRARLLRYLKKTCRIRYETLLKSVALEPESVEGELVI